MVYPVVFIGTCWWRSKQIESWQVFWAKPALLVVVLLAQIATGPAQALDLGEYYVAKYGNRYGDGPNKRSHQLTFEGNWRELILKVDGYDIDKPDEVAIYLDGNLLTYLRPTPNRETRTNYIDLGTPAKGSHTLRFVNKHPKNRWGVSNIRLERRMGPILKPSLAHPLSHRLGSDYGNGRHFGGAQLRFEREERGLTLLLHAYDIDKPDEVGVYFNGAWVGHLRESGPQRHKITSIAVPSAVQTDNNELILRLKNPGRRWGLARVEMKPTALPSAHITIQAPSQVQTPTHESTQLAPEPPTVNPQPPTVVQPVAYSCSGVDVQPSENLAQVARRAGEGATLCVRAGVHRPTRIVPVHGQKFLCEPGAIINGSLKISGTWYSDNEQWVISGAPTAIYGNGGPGIGRDEAVRYHNDLFIDGQPLRRVSSRAAVNAHAVYFGGELMYAGTFAQDGDRLYTAINPNGKLVEYSVERWAFFASGGTADNGVIENCIVEKYATGDIEGAIELKNTANWTLRNVTSRLNHSGGLRTGIGTRVIGGAYVHNGQIGIMGAGNTGAQNKSRNIEITGVTVSHNNYQEYDPLWHAGGIKYFTSDQVAVKDSTIQYNYGVGLWFDYDNQNTIVTGNTISHNTSIGLELEAVFFGNVSGNTLHCNARLGRHALDRVWFWGSNLMVKNSQGFTIDNNDIIVDEGQGISIIDNTDRGYHPSLGQRRTINNTVTNNRIRFTHRSRSGYFEGRNGVESDAGSKASGMNAADPSANNRLFGNTYEFSDSGFPHWRINGISFVSGQLPSLWESSSAFLVQPAASLTGLCP